MRFVVVAVGLGALAGCRWNFDERLVDAAQPCTPVVDVAAISSGRDFSCALLTDGRVQCWGAGEAGQLGDGARATRPSPVTVGLGPATMVSAGVQHACAVVSGGVWCWGRNDASQLGTGDQRSRELPVQVAGLPSDVAGVSAGGLHTCAWTASGAMYCWGQANGVTGGSATAVEVTGVPAIVKVATSSAQHLFSANHACAIGADGSAWCWGTNLTGQLGIGDETVVETDGPVRVSTSLAFVDIASGHGHTCGRTAAGVVACWGIADDGQLGNGATQARFAPVVVSVAPSVEIAAHHETTCSRDRDGNVTCWGDNDRQQLGRAGEDALVPEAIEVPPARAISVGNAHSCAVAQDGVVRCWGSDRAGQRSGVLDPGAVDIDVDAISIAAGGDTTCALTSDARVRCWGFGAHGQIGDGMRASRVAPADVGLANVIAIDVGADHACAVLGDGRVACWGSNDSDRVAFGGAAIYPSPQIVGGIGIAATRIAAGGGHTCAIGPSGVPWCWGNADEGTLGGPVSPAGVTREPIASMFADAAGISTGLNHTCITTTTGAIWCSGRDNEGQIGRGDNAGDVYAPLEVTDAPSSAMVSAGGWHTCAISTTGTGWCWGNNVVRQLGDDSEVRSEVPRALPLTGLLEIAASDHHTCARDATRVWCWGANTSGQLGDRTLASRGVPTLATDLEGAVELALGTSHTCVRRADNTVRCVGAREFGQPVGDSIPSQAPRAVPLTCR